MKNKNIFISFLIKLLVAVFFGTLCFFSIFEKLDFRLYDALVKFRKEPVQNENIILVKIDDPSIKQLGEWPWGRDIIADALLRMKEFGAYNAIFDIEYISPTKNGIAPAAENKIYNQVFATEDIINTMLNQISAAIEQGYYKADEVPDLINQMINGQIEPAFDELQNFILDNMARNNDEYFAQCLQFFGKAYLTINHYNLGYDVTTDEESYIKKRFLTDRIDGSKELVRLGNEYQNNQDEQGSGFNPALHKLITHSAGAHFTNSVVDNDGVRRRIQLLYWYKDYFINQLAFGPYLEIVDSKDLVREKDYLIVKNAKNTVTGSRSDIKIPLDQHGRMIINFRHGSSDDSFKNDSIINLINMDETEKNIVQLIANIAGNPVSLDDGSEMDYTIYAYDLLDLYEQIDSYKTQLLSQCTGFDDSGNVLAGISQLEYEKYFSMRKKFFENVTDYVAADYLTDVNARLEELKGLVDQQSINQIKDWLSEDFDNLKSHIRTYNTFYDELSKLYKDSYCIIGNTATSTTDIGANPYLTTFMNVGIHANVLNTLLNQDFIVNVRWWWGFGLAVILALLMLAFTQKGNVFQNVIGFIAYLTYCLAWGALFVFNKYYIQFIGTILYLFVDLLAMIGFRFFLSTKEKQFITQIAASFANKDTVNELRKNPDAFKTEGQKKCITALFSDIQKFSTLSESIGKMYGDEGPNKLIEILNEYLGRMSNEILRNSGNIDKYEGDAIISMFGAPDPMNSHSPQEWAYLCLDSAIRMKKVEVQFNEEHKDLFEPKEITLPDGKKEIIQLKPLQTRIGVNSGDAFVGLMGSKTETFSKLNYTMIGDTVNLASRLEGVNKAYGSWIMCSDDTWNMANSGIHKGEITAKRLDRVRVVGRSTPVQLYSIVGFTKELTNDQKQEIEIFHAALDKYLQRDFANAGKLFMQADKMGDGDPIALVFADRCKNFIKKGVEESWDGVINMTSK